MENRMSQLDLNKLVSVIVPIFRVEKYLDECIESIVTQTYTNLEIILVDDGSDDSCACACDSWAQEDDRIISIHKNNGGLSDSRNVGLEIFKGEYVNFIDSDDWVDDIYIERLLSVAIDEKADVVVDAMVHEYEKLGKSYYLKKQYFSGNSEQALIMLYDQTKIAICATKLYKRYIWENLRFPYGKLYEDLLTICRVFDLANKIVQIPDGLYHYRIRDDSIMTSKFSLKIVGICDAWKENYLFCEKNYHSVAPLARMFWLEIIPSVIAQFPSSLDTNEKQAKKKLKKEILENFWFILKNMPLKKTFYIMKSVCFM